MSAILTETTAKKEAQNPAMTEFESITSALPEVSQNKPLKIRKGRFEIVLNDEGKPCLSEIALMPYRKDNKMYFYGFVDENGNKVRENLVVRNNRPIIIKGNGNNEDSF